MQQLQRHARLTQLDVQLRRLGHRPALAPAAARTVQTLIERVLAHHADRRPIEPDGVGATDCTGYRATADADTARRLAVAALQQQLVPQNLSQVPHR